MIEDIVCKNCGKKTSGHMKYDIVDGIITHLTITCDKCGHVFEKDYPKEEKKKTHRKMITKSSIKVENDESKD